MYSETFWVCLDIKKTIINLRVVHKLRHALNPYAHFRFTWQISVEHLQIVALQKPAVGEVVDWK